MSLTEIITKRKLKVKVRIGSYVIGGSSKIKPCELPQRLADSVLLGSQSNNSAVEKSLDTKVHSFDTMNVKKFSMGSKKRSLSEVNDGQKKKRRKMDRSVIQQCTIILKKLMDHPAGWVFNQPVDLVKLGLPDYFDIISEPMDLGTVKRKLNNNEYSTVDQFSAHVRLTFSNAMRYNPLDNNVHRMAKELNNLFDMKWNALGEKWNGGKKTLQDRQDIIRNVNCIDDSCKSVILKPTSNLRSEPKKLKSPIEKQKLKKQLLILLSKKVPSHLQSFLKKSGLNLHSVEKIGNFVDSLGDEDLLKLKKVIRTSRLMRIAKVAISRKPDHAKIIHKGIDNGIRDVSLSVKVLPSTNSGTYASSDISSVGSHDELDAIMKDCEVKFDSDRSLEKSEIQSKGNEHALHETQMGYCSRFSSTDTTTTISQERSDYVQLSIQKALRVVSLKNRFADTILKAKQKAIQNQVPLKFKKEKERLESQEQEERATIEAQIRASKEAARKRAEAEMKLQRQREREAARLGLQRMVKTVDIDNDHTVVNDLRLLSGCSFPDQYSCSTCESSPEVVSGDRSHFSRALEKFGLFIKDDYYMEYEDDNGQEDIEDEDDNGQEDIEECELIF